MAGGGCGKRCNLLHVLVAGQPKQTLMLTKAQLQELDDYMSNIKVGFRCVCSFCKAELPHSDRSATVVSHGMCNPPCQQAIDMGWGEVMEKKSTIASLIVAGALLATSFVSCAHAATWDQFLDALATVESNNNPEAIGDNGRSRGAYQIQLAVWQDVNKSRAMNAKLPFGTGSKSVQARDFAFSHLTNLQSRLATATGHNPTASDLYAAWNLGFKGFQRRGFLLSRCPITTQRAAAKLNTILNKP